MGDLFHEDVPTMFIIDALSVMAETSRHTFLLLTKRPERMREIMSHETVANDVWLQTLRGVNAEPSPWPLPNVWLGVTAENQEQADKRIPILLQIPAAVRFVSVEPMLGPVDLRAWLDGHGAYGPAAFCKHCGIIETTTESNHEAGDFDVICEKCGSSNIYYAAIDWVICGGESGPCARPMHRDWARNLRDQCQAAGTRFFFKQWGEYAPNWLNDENDKEIPGSMWMDRMGKRVAGRLLDGREWNEFPEVS
jgi:protein gp37